MGASYAYFMNASAAGKHTFRSHITFFSYSKLKSRLKRVSLAKKKLILKILAIFAESVPSSLLISVDFFVGALGSRGGGTCPKCPLPPLDTRLGCLFPHNPNLRSLQHDKFRYTFSCSFIQFIAKSFSCCLVVGLFRQRLRE